MNGVIGINPMHITTPLWDLSDLGFTSSRQVFLKMECFQPIGSFKLRGIGLLCQQSVREGKHSLISSSGGNAGLAVAYAARKLRVKATVVVPTSTSASTCQRLESHGANVVVHGEAWDDADLIARELAGESAAAYIPPFDHPVIWQGHSSMIDEIAALNVKADVVVVAVGGGGLLCGVLEGMHRHGWIGTRVIAVETEGAQSLHCSMQAGELVTLPAITSVAKSLGARRVAGEALVWTRRHPVESVVVTDTAALAACARFAFEQRVLVEPACGAALSVVYEKHSCLAGSKCVLVIVCGGVNVDAVIPELQRRQALATYQ